MRDRITKADLFNSELSEPIFIFVSQNDIFDKFCEISIEKDYSIAEFVYHCYFERFRSWYEKNYLC